MVINGEYPEVFCCTVCGSTEHLTGYSHAGNGVSAQTVMREARAEKLLESTIFTMQYVVATPVEKLYTFTVSDGVLDEFSRIQERFRKTYVDRKFKTLEILESLQI